MGLIFHRFLKSDLRSVLAYYTEEVGPKLAERFVQEFDHIVATIEQQPHRFHPFRGDLRRANFKSFPYHLLYRETGSTIKILVLRHHRRDPKYGTERQ
jgi:toxin ParE1/3/4